VGLGKGGLELGGIDRQDYDTLAIHPTAFDGQALTNRDIEGTRHGHKGRANGNCTAGGRVDHVRGDRGHAQVADLQVIIACFPDIGGEGGVVIHRNTDEGPRREGEAQRSGLGCAITQGNRGRSGLAAVIALGSEEGCQPIGGAFRAPIELDNLESGGVQIRRNEERLTTNPLGVAKLFILARRQTDRAIIVAHLPALGRGRGGFDRQPTIQFRD